MKRYEAIEKGIQRNDVIALREAIGSICYTGQGFDDELKEVIAYVESKGIKLKDKHLVGKLVSEGKTTFTRDDFTDAVFELKENFCDERVAEVIKIGKSITGKNIEKKAEMPKTNRRAVESPKVKSHQDSNILKKVGILVAVTIAVVVFVAFVVWLVKR